MTRRPPPPPPRALPALALLLALAVALLPPAAADCRGLNDFCNSTSPSASDQCCSGGYCQAYQCWPPLRDEDQPCIPGKTGYGCESPFVCDPVYFKCMAALREEYEPCQSTTNNCNPASNLVCDPILLHCVKRGTRNTKCVLSPYDTCDTEGKIEGIKFTCHASRAECFAYPRQSDDPCTTAAGEPSPLYPCAEGTYCEVGVTNECQDMGASRYANCHATLPCMGPNWSCDIGTRSCFHNPRWEGEPCNDADGERCKAGMFCDIKQTRTCLYAQGENDHCYTVPGKPDMGRPCRTRLVCDSTDMKCYKANNRRENNPCKKTKGARCDPDYACSPWRSCTAPSTDDWNWCYGNMDCLSTEDRPMDCQPGIQACFDVPRLEGQPCDSKHPCGPGLLPCVANWPWCMAP